MEDLLSYEGYRLVFEDDFDGSELDRSHWNVELHEPGWVNEELQRYVDCRDNICLRDGKLLIRPIKTVHGDGSVTYTSGRITTQYKHDFALLWEPGLLRWYVDGRPFYEARERFSSGPDGAKKSYPDTFARDLSDYPSTAHFHDSPHYVEYTEDVYVGYRYFETLPGAAERVCYPFGFGLSYTTFALETVRAGAEDGQIWVAVRVTNTGSRAGKEVVQLYYRAPWGLLQKPKRCLAAFRKTKRLEPGESETVELSFAVSDMASFDDLGKIAPSAWVLEKGRYALYVGTSVRDTVELDWAWEQTETEVVRTVSDSLAPSNLPKRLLGDGSWEELPAAPAVDTRANLLRPIPAGQAEAVAPAAPGRGRWMLPRPYADGPAGLRIQPEAGVCTTAWPCATLLAAAWDTELVSRVGAAAAAEVKENNISVWLAPAVNIHRSPLCGRNFEYFSEDPLLTGKLAGAMVEGIQSQNIAATVKHFACNNKETNRKYSDSRLSRRALREIYLRAFEIIVREAQPWAIMSSYNVVNGRRASESRELLTDILRGDWGYTGMVMSDWWTRGEHYKELLAGNDLKMANGYPERVQKAMKLGAVSRHDLEICAGRVLELILKVD